MDLAALYNWFEVVAWSAYAVVLTLMARREHGRRRSILLTAAVAFLAFAVSDAIEVQTGAWWRPVWLLLLKASCIATFLGCFIAWRKTKAG